MTCQFYTGLPYCLLQVVPVDLTMRIVLDNTKCLLFMMKLYHLVGLD